MYDGTQTLIEKVSRSNKVREENPSQPPLLRETFHLGALNGCFASFLVLNTFVLLSV